MKKYTYFLSDYHELSRIEKIGKGNFLFSINDSVDPYDYHVLKCENAFTELWYEQFITCYSDNEEADEDSWRTQQVLNDLYAANEAEDKSDFCNGTNEVVEIFNQKCVMCFENPSVYFFVSAGISVYVNFFGLMQRMNC